MQDSISINFIEQQIDNLENDLNALEYQKNIISQYIPGLKVEYEESINSIKKIIETLKEISEELKKGE